MPSLPYTARLQLGAFAAAQRADGSIRPQLFALGDLKASARPSANSGVSSVDMTMDASRGLWARVFCPQDTSDGDRAKLPVVVYFHGGGFVLFSPASRLYDALCRRLCSELGAVVVSVSYRLAPRHRFPAAYDDGVAALQYLYENALLGDHLAHVPVDLSSCFVAGDSSGGNIAHHVAQRWASMSPASPPVNLRLAGAILIQPFIGGEERTGSELALANVCPSLTLATADYYWREFLPEGATRDHAAARVCGPDADITKSFPPTMVVVGGFDLLKDRHARYVEKLRHMGKSVELVEYPEAIHGFYVFPEIADSGKLMEKINLFVEEHRSKRVV